MNNRMLGLFAIVICLSSSVFGQDIDPGEPDTLIIGTVSANANQKVIVEVNLVNDEEISSLTIPLKWSSPDIILDSVSYIGSRVDYLSYKPITIYQADQEVIFGAVVIMESYIPAGTGLIGKLYFDIPAGTPDQHIYIDTVTRGAAYILFTDADAGSFVPIIISGKITVGNPQLPPHIELSPTSMNFNANLGFPSPSSQGLTITNSGEGVLEWTASSDAAWLTAVPNSGTATSNTAIQVDISGLGVGSYSGNITITCDEADNSPQTLPVSLEITRLSPEIEADPSVISVSAVQGGTNPDNRYLYISTGILGSELNWTVTNSESWLTLSPLSGTPPDSVQLSFDITAMAYGDYSDTIIITDPEATNSPHKVPVNLQIVSDLPIIEINPPALYVVASVGVDANPYSFNISNSGEGSLDFTITENSSRIINITPSSGAAPENVVISFDTDALAEGRYYDTIIVSSSQAINSPQELIIRYDITGNPAELRVLPTHLEMEYFECWQGLDATPPQKYFRIENIGGGSLYWIISNRSDWLVIEAMEGWGVYVNTVTLDADHLPAGVYVDTITVTSISAMNSPRTVVVTLNVNEGTETPELVVGHVLAGHYSGASQDTVIAQEVFGSTQGEIVSLCQIVNQNAGCMDYRIEEDIPWIRFLSLTGTAPANVELALEIGDYKYGIYSDSFFVHSETASNSPVKVDITLWVWRLHGDFDWSNSINVGDAVFMINYIFKHGFRPIPEYLVGDCNCDKTINIGDLIIVIDYIFKKGDKPCGNL